MKTFFVIASLTLFLAACGQSDEPAAVAAPEVAAPEVSETPMQSSAASGELLVDYIWNNTADDMTEAQMAGIIDGWNARIDAGGYNMLGANVLMPQFETDDYDLIWVVMWPSSEAREAGWADWNANQVDDWSAELAGAMSYEPENVYTFKPTDGHDGMADIAVGGTFHPRFDFCAFNEGQDAASLAAFRAEYDAWLVEGESNNYGYYLMEPQFDLADADFVWLDLFGDEAAVEAGTASWSGSALEASWEAMATCENFAFVATCDQALVPRGLRFIKI
jgi:hypothetical protein